MRLIKWFCQPRKGEEWMLLVLGTCLSILVACATLLAVYGTLCIVMRGFE